MPQQKLRRNLKNRHIQLIALGGAVGTGLFLGSAGAMQMAGPSIILSYAVGGVIAFLIMRQLGEMMAQEPVAGSFSNLAQKYWGNFPGLLSGLNYWVLYVLVGMAELTAVAKYIQYWFPHLESWHILTFFFILINAINLATVKMFGEIEFWFAIIKVLAIIGMIILGSYLLMSGNAGPNAGIRNLWIHDGFFPFGLSGFILSLPVVMFSFGGLELIGIAAAETDDPQKTIPKAVNQVIYRILIFYVGALIILLSLNPWNQGLAPATASWSEAMVASPFVKIFSNLGIHSAAHILNLVVLTAALSVYNSCVYCNSRMLYGLSLQGNAPKIFGRVNVRGVPVFATAVSSFATLICIGLNYYMPEEALGILFALVVSTLVLNWAMISLTHLFFRKAYEKKGTKIVFKSILYPWTNYFCIGFTLFMLAVLYKIGKEESVIVLPIWVALIFILYTIKKKNAGKGKFMKE